MIDIFLSKRAAKTMFEEAQRWVDIGIDQMGSPLESMFYPLSALVPHSSASIRCPLETAGIEEIQQVVVDDVAIPPDHVKSYTTHNCHFDADDIEAETAAFNATIDARVAKQPRLSVNTKAHCHPFAAGNFLSGGDMHHGVTAPKATAWRRRRGLASAILQVVYPRDAPQRARGEVRLDENGATVNCDDGSTVWRLRSWASRARDAGTSARGKKSEVLGGENADLAMTGLEMVDLGDARVVDDDHRSIQAARRPVYWQTAAGKAWCDGQKAALRDAGFNVSRNVLGRGWRRYLLSDLDLVIALPPDFPHLPPRVIDVKRAWADDYRLLALPDRDEHAGFKLSLKELVTAIHGRQKKH